MKYVEKEDRSQIMLLPDSIEQYVSEDNPVRVIDAFVDGLDMGELGFERSVPDATGRPPYDPRDLLKLYIYGYFNRIRSSRKLMQECGRNVEVMYLLGKLRPDFRTIADFRKNNAKALRNVFKAFVKLCLKLKLYKRELLAVDGTKCRAVNSKNNAYNAEILHKKLCRIDEHIAQYLRQMDASDAKQPASRELGAEQIKAAVAELKTRKEKYEGYLEELKETGKTQILTTDPDCHRMHTKNGFNCCYNVQTAVDAGSHLIAEYEVTGNNTDQGLLNEMSEKAKEALDLETVEVVADKGYESRRDILECIMNGTVPNVAFKYDKTERIYNLDHVEAEITEETRSSTKPEDIQKSLHAGVLPKCYEGTAIEVELQQENEIGCFTRNEDGTVTCPMGQILHKLKDKDPGAVYASKDACRQCPNRCTNSKSHKTVYFGPGTKHVAVKMYGNPRFEVRKPPEGHVFHNAFYRKDAAKKKVLLCIREDKAKLKQRMCTVEHPFGTIKWYGGAHYLLCKGKEKVSAEIGLSYLAYNLRRAINMVGVKTLIAAIVMKVNLSLSFYAVEKCQEKRTPKNVVIHGKLTPSAKQLGRPYLPCYAKTMEPIYHIGSRGRHARPWSASGRLTALHIQLALYQRRQGNFIGGVTAFTVVVSHPLENAASYFIKGQPVQRQPVDQFFLQCGKKALHSGVIGACAGSSHTLPEAF